jgi:tetratricopeptide (TPR) repeat protein
VEIPNTGVSIGEFYRYLAGWLGHQTHITGEVWKSGSVVSITARAGSDGAATVGGKESDFNALMQKAAEAIYLHTQPYRYAAYIEKGGAFPHGDGAERLARGKAILQQLSIEGVTLRERAWANVGLGVNELYSGNIPGSVSYYRQAIAILPDLPLAWDDLDAQENNLEHEEATVIAARRSVSLLSGAGAVDMTPRARAIILPADRGVVAFYTGDYQAAFDDYTAASRRPDYSGTVENSLEWVAAVLAFQHDGRAGRAAWHNLPPASDAATLDGRKAFKPQVDFAAGDWHAVLMERSSAEAGLKDTFSRNEAATQLWPYFARAMAETGDIAGAEALIARTPMDCDMCVRVRGQIAALKHEWTNAARWYAIVASRSPDVPFADSEWGQMLMAKGDFDGAIAKFAIANQTSPHFADPLEMWGEALIAKKRSDLALAKFEEANKYAPNWGRLHLKWGEALLWSSKSGEAQMQFTTAAQRDLSPSEKSELARVTHG